MRPSVAIVAGVALVGGVLVVRQLVTSAPASPEPTTQAERASPEARAATSPRTPQPMLPPPSTVRRPPAERVSEDTQRAEAAARVEASSGSATAPEGSAGRGPTGAPLLNRHGLTAIKPRPDQAPSDPQAARVAPTFTGAEGAAQRRQFGKVVERAACHAPDFQERLAKLPEARRAELVKSCAELEVKPRTEPKPPRR